MKISKVGGNGPVKPDQPTVPTKDSKKPVKK